MAKKKEEEVPLDPPAVVKEDKPKFKLPKTIGACADRLYLLRQDRLAKQKVVELIAAEESALREYIINTLPKSEASGVAGKVARVTVVTKTCVAMKDWALFWAKFDKKKDSDLLQRRLNDAAVKERWDNGKTVPGAKASQIVDISLNKV